jgi:hypothetical protein
MIEFYGELSEECKRYMQNTVSKIRYMTFPLLIVILCTPIIIAAIMWNWIFILGLLVTIPGSVFAVMPDKKGANLVTPTRITIEQESMESEGDKFYHSRNMSDVKKIIDLGGWYHIIFYFPHKSMYFVCQKNLIVKGTGEEFEKLFEGKIVRKKI